MKNKKITSSEAVAGKWELNSENVYELYWYIWNTDNQLFQMHHKHLSFCDIPLKAYFCMARSNLQNKTIKIDGLMDAVLDYNSSAADGLIETD